MTMKGYFSIVLHKNMLWVLIKIAGRSNFNVYPQHMFIKTYVVGTH